MCPLGLKMLHIHIYDPWSVTELRRFTVSETISGRVSWVKEHSHGYQDARFPTRRFHFSHEQYHSLSLLWLTGVNDLDRIRGTLWSGLKRELSKVKSSLFGNKRSSLEKKRKLSVKHGESLQQPVDPCIYPNLHLPPCSTALSPPLPCCSHWERVQGVLGLIYDQIYDFLDPFFLRSRWPDK